MVNAVSFEEEKDGYNKEQVDGYVGKLAEAYQAAFEENQGLQEKYDNLLSEYNNLLSEYKKMEYQNHTQLNAAVIGKTMANMEALARKIIEEKQWIDRLIS